jgi:hypothetical protein
VTISLLDLAKEGTQLTYCNVGAALTGRAAALNGGERMLDVGEFSSRTAPVIAIPLTVFPGIGTAVNVATALIGSSLGSCWGHGSPRVRTPVRRHVPAGTFRQPAPSAADGAGLAGCSAPLTTLVNLGHRQVVCAFVAAVLTLVRAPSAIQNLPVLAELARVR